LHRNPKKVLCEIRRFAGSARHCAAAPRLATPRLARKAINLRHNMREEGAQSAVHHVSSAAAHYLPEISRKAFHLGYWLFFD